MGGDAVPDGGGGVGVIDEVSAVLFFISLFRPKTDASQGLI